MCNCAGGYSGNDCGTRLCPKGDDPLTHEVENSGDGRASQQSEVQTVTFNGGRGLGGTATLTYNDLYGQSWTTRPFNVGGDNVYRLEVSIVPGTTCGSDKCAIDFSYNGLTVSVQTHANSGYAISSKLITAASLRAGLLPLFAGHRALDYVGKDRGNTLYVREHYSTTSVKIGGSVHAATRVTFDIAIPIDMSNHDDNGQLTTGGFAAAWGATPAANTQELNLYQLGDRSAEIEAALTSLPNQVVPSVTVAKVGYSDADTLSTGALGNVYGQSYSITFNNEANSGDQNMLSCNAAPCDDNGCINRGPGVSEVRYMHHDAENYGEGINFVNQGYFIMDIGSDAAEDALSAGSIKIMWDTGAGIDSAIFAIVATAAEVQTALRTITGWEACTVELWGSKAANNAGAAAQVLLNHQFKVTFAAGYDDLGKSPTFYTMKHTDGAYAAASPSTARARIYDQRFSNSIWLGKSTGFIECTAGDASTCSALKHTALDGTQTTITPLAQNGDRWHTSEIMFGVGGTGDSAGVDPNTASATIRTNVDAKSDTAMGATLVGNLQFAGAGLGFVYLYEGATSLQTSDYFAVGVTVEVLGVSYDSPAFSCADKFGVAGTGGAGYTTHATCVAAADCGAVDDDCVWAYHGHTDTAASASTSNNLYRKFKVTGHVTNEFNREFAKLDSFPADDGLAHAALNNAKPDYNLKITSNNATVHSYDVADAQITVNEKQIIIFGTGLSTETATFKLYMGGEESQDMDEASTDVQIAEEINSFSHLSGPVAVVAEENNWVVTFDAKDGDVPQMTASSTVSVFTRANGWSIEGNIGLGLNTMQAGGIINVTAAEECTFALGSATAGYFCYDGVCGEVAATADTTGVQDAMDSVVDDNGDKMLTTTTTGTTSVKVVMPMGKSCDGLEYRIPADVTVTKTVEKNNNGKSFKITRSFMQSSTLAADNIDATADTGGVTITCAASATAGCHQVLDDVDSAVISDVSACGAARDGTNDGAVFPIVRTVTAVTANAAGTQTLTIGRVAADTPVNVANSNCKTRIARHVITLDSMPTGSLTTVAKTLLYTSPVGSCSVSETTKGTYESYECSNRGACDGKSGLCTCYEGYSGQSCQTQTVLV
jgi:hypothetical protein